MKPIPLLVLIAVPTILTSQVIAPKEGASMGHLHFNSKDPELQKKFWIDVIGARPATLGTFAAVQIPGALIIINKAVPNGPTEGSVVNHVGVKVRDLQTVLKRADAAAITVVTRNPKQAMLLAPDDVRVELSEDPASPEPAMNHHIHFYTPDVEATKKWYVSTFGAIPGKRGPFEAADLPGVNLTFSKSDSKLEGTKGRALDHIGFEIANLEAFTKQLESGGVKMDVPYRKIPALNIAIAFFTDPWGTYIELTEGLAQVR